MRGQGTPMPPTDPLIYRKITMSGKFLPYKYYGASGNVPEYGFKEG
jgi:cyanate lyase